MENAYKKIKKLFRVRHKTPDLSGISEKAERIYWILQDRSPNGKTVEMSQEELVVYSHFSKQTVSKYLKELRKAGVLDWRRRGAQTNVYNLDVKTIRQQASEGHFPDFIRNGLLGRGYELGRAKEHLVKQRHCLLVGPEGVGKTAILKELANHNGWTDKEIIYLPQAAPAKPMLLALLHKVGYSDKVGNKSIRELSMLAARELAKKDYILLLDDLDGIKPLQAKEMEPLLERAQVVGACRQKKASAGDFWYAFAQVNIEPLDEEHQRELIGRYLDEKGIFIIDDPTRKLLIRELIRKSGGNLKILFRLLDQVRTEGEIDRRWIVEELGVEEEGYKELIVGPYIILIGAIVMAIRYLGLGLGDRELYMMAGMGYALFMIFRYFSYSWRRKDRK
jgi:DNA-binding Lrp family transcriptional regulator